MNDPNGTDDLERDLSRSLHRQAEQLSAAPVSLADVRGRARGITRRRRLATAAGLAAAAAVLVPTAMVLAPGPQSAPRPAGPHPTEQATPEDARPGGDGLDPTRLPTGPTPAIAHLDLTGSPTVVRPDGTRVVLETERSPDGFTLLTDRRYVVTTTGDGARRVEVTDPDGATTASYPLSGGVAVGPDLDQVAWAAPTGAVWVLQSGDAEPRQLGRLGGDHPEVVSLVGGDCFERVLAGGSGGCLVTADVTREDGSPVGWVLSTTGADGPVHSGSGPDDPAVLAVADEVVVGDPTSQEFEDYLAGITQVRDDGTCSGIWGPRPDRTTTWLAETCEHRFGTFSPGATLVSAWETYGDGLGHREIGMYDVRSGRLQWSRTAAGPTHVHSAAWEDADHLLAPVWHDGRWTLVRFGPDGGMERAAGPAAGGEADPAYLPATLP